MFLLFRYIFCENSLSIVEAARYLNRIEQGSNILFLLGGRGDYYKKCMDAAKGLENVIFLGWLNSDGIKALNSVSSVGVIPSLEEVSLPNKAFSYLGAGLPVISSSKGDLNNLLEKYHAGFYFDISNPIQLANKILDLSKLDDKLYNRISENAKSLFKEHFQADKIYKKYADYVEHIVDKYGSEKPENTPM